MRFAETEVTAAVMLGVSVLGFLCHLPGCVRATWNRLTSVKWKCFCPPVRDECLSEQICQQKTVWSQKLSWYVSERNGQGGTMSGHCRNGVSDGKKAMNRWLFSKPGPGSIDFGLPGLPNRLRANNWGLEIFHCM